MADGRSLDDLLPGVLAGRTRCIAKLMSRAEAGFDGDQEVLAEIHRHAGNAHVIGVTGAPGSGKSTLVGALTRAFRAANRTVGIVAVDPSSSYSGGAILADRLRMSGLTGDAGVFIRPMAARGAMGGLASASLDTVDILDAAGFDLVLIETVGVGQGEVDIVQAAHTVVVVTPPGLGDGIQAMKAGIFEIADIHAVSKCDRADAAKTVAELKAALPLGLTGKDRFGWLVPVLATSAERDEGIDGLRAAIDGHRAHLGDSGEMDRRRRRSLQMRIVKIAEDILRKRISDRRGDKLSELLDKVIAGDLDRRAAALALLADSNEK